MTESSDPYYAAFLRERKARREIEQLLEDSTRQLYEKNQVLERQIRQIKVQQQSLLQQEKLATLGSLAAGVAHEINNPLAFVISNIDVLCRYSNQLISAATDHTLSVPEQQLRMMQEDLPELESDINHGLVRIKDIVKHLLFFGRTDSDQPTQIPLQDVVNLSLKLLGPKLKDVVVHTSVSFGSAVWFNPSELNQMLVNILINAIQACEVVADRQAEITIAEIVSDNKITLTISDNGCGMSEETQTRMYDPFFTTKPVGTGTGIGMAMVLQVLKKHNCSISVHSVINQGSSICIEFPR
ncbi:sensor histidine kinase [Rheinheimera gaetbuli]